MTESTLHISLASTTQLVTNFYTTALNRQYQQRFELSTSCPLEILNLDFQRINAQLHDQYEALLPLLEDWFAGLEHKPINILLIPNITLHTAIARLSLSERLQTILVDPIKTGIEVLQQQGVKRITLAGTRHTMQTGLLARFFEEAGIKVLFPKEEDIDTLDSLRLKVDEEGFDPKLAKQMHKTLAPYKKVVLACTELSILDSEPESPFTDLVQLQIGEAVKRLG